MRWERYGGVMQGMVGMVRYGAIRQGMGWCKVWLSGAGYGKVWWGAAGMVG